MNETDGSVSPQGSEEETGFMRWFHLIFGHGSAENPGGSSRQEFAGWGLVLSPIIVPILGLIGAEGEPGGYVLLPLMVVIGILLVRSAKKMPRRS